MSDLLLCPICDADGTIETDFEGSKVVVCQECTCTASLSDWQGRSAKLSLTPLPEEASHEVR